MPEKRHKINKLASYQKMIVRNSPAFDRHGFVASQTLLTFFFLLLLLFFLINVHDQHRNPLTRPLIALQVVRASSGLISFKRIHGK